MTFINYVESLWVQMAISITDAWKRTLQVIEPAFIEFVHYVESLAWDVSKTFIGESLLYHNLVTNCSCSRVGLFCRGIVYLKLQIVQSSDTIFLTKVHLNSYVTLLLLLNLHLYGLHKVGFFTFYFTVLLSNKYDFT